MRTRLWATSVQFIAVVKWVQVRHTHQSNNEWREGKVLPTVSFCLFQPLCTSSISSISVFHCFLCLFDPLFLCITHCTSVFPADSFLFFQNPCPQFHITSNNLSKISQKLDKTKKLHPTAPTFSTPPLLQASCQLQPEQRTWLCGEIFHQDCRIVLVLPHTSPAICFGSGSLAHGQNFKPLSWLDIPSTPPLRTWASP